MNWSIGWVARACTIIIMYVYVDNYHSKEGLTPLTSIVHLQCSLSCSMADVDIGVLVVYADVDIGVDVNIGVGL